MKRQKGSTLARRSVPALDRAKGLLGISPGGNFADGTVTIPEGDLRRIGFSFQGNAGGSQFREEFRLIKRPILGHMRSGALPSGNDPRIILVTSGSPNEGKTFIASNLALSLALERDLQVTLIDADIEAYGLSSMYGVASDLGLMDILHDPSIRLDEVLRPTNAASLSILPVGENRYDSAELIAGESFGELLKGILQRPGRQVIVMDSTSVLSGSSAISLAERAGQIIFVVASNETRHVNIDESLRLLNRALAPMEGGAGFGFVLNKTRPSRSGARYIANPA